MASNKEIRDLIELVDRSGASPDIFAVPTEDYGTHQPYVAPKGQKLYNLLTGSGGEERFQFWPEKMIRSGLSLPADVIENKVLSMPGLRREDYTDVPGKAQPADTLVERAQDLVGLGMTGVFGAKPRSLGSAGGKMVQMTDEVAKVPMFYSAVEKAVQGSKQNTATPEQWLGYLKNQPGVRQEELGWLKLDELPKGSITKKQLEDHITANKVELKENLRSNEKSIESLNDKSIEYFHISYEKLDKYQKQFVDNKVENLAPTKFSGYQLPGGENYRELVVSLPEKVGKIKVGQENGVWFVEYPNGVKFGNYTQKRHAEDVAKAIDRKEFGASEPYKSSHWDEPNPLYHVRMNDRIINGKKSLHVEEIQSDWHQAGRKHGYDNPVERMKVEDKLNKAGYPISGEDAGLAASNGIITEAEAKLISNRGYIPDAPFKKTWDELALKRIIREAAEKGYDQISWTPGEAQAARYDLSKHIDNIDYLKSKDGKTVTLNADKDGNHVFSKTNVPVNEIDNFVGKEVADRIRKDTGELDHNTGYYRLEDLDLKVGGEGMKGFYDKMLVDKANALAKKYGVKVEKGEIKTKEDFEPGSARAGLGDMKFSEPVWTLKLTPEMKKDVLEKGFPLFSASPILTPVDTDPFQKKHKLTKIEHNPFAKKQPKLTPVDFDPWQ